jgi:hypothetical protein
MAVDGFTSKPFAKPIKAAKCVQLVKKDSAAPSNESVSALALAFIRAYRKASAVK